MADGISPTRVHVTVTTIGYEGRTLAGFVDVLASAGVQVLVDVRLKAMSRRRGFAKTALSTALRERGIGYVHLRELGNPREIRDSAMSTEDCLAMYADHMSTRWDDALPPLLALIKARSSIALMCMERDPATCHRTIVANEAARRLNGRVQAL